MRRERGVACLQVHSLVLKGLEGFKGRSGDMATGRGDGELLPRTHVDLAAEETSQRPDELEILDEQLAYLAQEIAVNDLNRLLDVIPLVIARDEADEAVVEEDVAYAAVDGVMDAQA
ncbi:hypothetical protein F5Y07DRAFT_404834 [Xylaria sp. FL0933]|nr:hypothetical protein F5Y07DRAFT_404834 [Xylaria sp. FL0933]